MPQRACSPGDGHGVRTRDKNERRFPTRSPGAAYTATLSRGHGHCHSSLARGSRKSPKEMHQRERHPLPPECHLHPPRAGDPRSHTGFRGSATNTHSDQGKQPLGWRAVPLSFKVSSCIFLTTSGALLSLFPATRKRKDRIRGNVVQTLLSMTKCCLEMQNITPEGSLYGFPSCHGVERGRQGSCGQRHLSPDKASPLAWIGEKDAFV